MTYYSIVERTLTLNKKDHGFIATNVEQIIDVSIARARHKQPPRNKFLILDSSIRAATGRRRLANSVKESYVKIFIGLGATANIVENGIAVEVDMYKLPLSVKQATAWAHANMN